MSKQKIDNRDRFSLRKLGIGAASVLAGVAMMAQSQLVHADENSNGSDELASDEVKAVNPKTTVESTDLGNGFKKEVTTSVKTEESNKTVLPHQVKRIKDETVPACKEVIKQVGRDGEKHRVYTTTEQTKVIKGNVEFLAFDKGSDHQDDPHYRMYLSGKSGQVHQDGHTFNQYMYFVFERDSYIDPKDGQKYYTNWRQNGYEILNSKKTNPKVANDGKDIKKTLAQVIAEYEKEVSIEGMTFKNKIAIDAKKDVKTQLLAVLPKGSKIVSVNGSTAAIEIALPGSSKREQKQVSVDPIDEIILYNDSVKPETTLDDQPTAPDQKPSKAPEIINIDKKVSVGDVENTPVLAENETNNAVREETVVQNENSNEAVRPHAAKEEKKSKSAGADKNTAVKAQLTKLSVKKNAAKAELPETGEAKSKVGILGLAIASLAGLLGIAADRKRN